MPDQYKEDKTEKATSKRRSEAREKGNVCHSNEVVLVIMLLGSVIGLYVFGPYMRDQMILQFKYLLSRMNEQFDSAGYVTFVITVVLNLVKIILPILSVILFCSFFSNFVQVGFIFTFEPLKPKFSKLKPKLGELNIFKKDQIVKLGASLGKLIIIIPVVYITITSNLREFVVLIDKSIPELLTFISMMIYKVVFRIALVLIVLAILDYVYRKWKFEEDMKMTKQEVKDEKKDMDQDPQIKSKIRSYGKELMRKLMFNEVPQADVVITNPTHIAVAIKYDPLNMGAPRVVAKGMRLIAEKIKKIAKENDVPVVENKPLARILYKTVDVGGEVPPDLYRAVAEVLAYVYRMNKKKMPSFAT
ncbi:flagellar biosynthesis protein FlhB [bacterium]|nr:flagellar biosynthesis protein FlhB [bacterium]